MKSKFGSALDFMGKSLDAAKNLAQRAAQTAEGKFDQALEIFDKAIELNPNDQTAYYYKGLIYRKKGEYNESLQFFDKVIELKPDDTDSYHQKGLIFHELGYRKEALECYNKEIEINPNKTVAYTSRSILYQEEDQSELAGKDIKQAANLLMRGHVFGLSVDSIKYILNTVKELEAIEKQNKQIAEKLNSVQGNDEEKKKINDSVKEYLSLLQNQAQKNAVQQVVNEVELADQNNDKEKIERLQKENEEKEQEIVSLKQKQEKCQQNIEQQNFAEIMKELNELRQNQIRQEQRIQSLESDNIDGGVREKAELNRQLMALQKEGQDIFNYYLTFYWTCLKMFLTYRVLSSGKIQANYKQTSTSAEFMEENKPTINEGLKMGLTIGKDICKGAITSIPIIGNIFGFIDCAVSSIICATNAYYKKKEQTIFFNKVNSINKIIENKFVQEENISIILAQTAIKLTKLRKDKIRSPTPEDDETQTGLSVKLSKTLSQIEDKCFAKEELHDKNNIAIQLALKDVTLLISYLCQNSSEIIKQAEPISEIFVDLIENKTVDKQLDQKLIPEKEDKTACCTIF